MLGKKKATSNYKGNSYKDHSFVACNTEVEGDIRFTGGLHVEGKVTGNILSDDGAVHIHGEVTGEIRAPHVVINGLVKGNVHAAEHIELAAKAVVQGNVYYKSMEMMLGAQVNGSLLHSDKSQPARIEHKPESVAARVEAATKPAANG
ncbi:MAG: bactofilin family protein [Moraxellaceae bacterium]